MFIDAGELAYAELICSLFREDEAESKLTWTMTFAPFMLGGEENIWSLTTQSVSEWNSVKKYSHMTIKRFEQNIIEFVELTLVVKLDQRSWPVFLLCVLPF